MQLEMGMHAGSAFLVVGGASLAFVVGGAMVFSTMFLSLAQPLPLVVIFSASSFIFVAVALMEMFRHAQDGYTNVLRDGDSSVTSTAAGLGQLFAIMSMVVGIITLYTVDAIIYRMSILVADRYGEAGMAQRPGGAVVTRGSFSQLDLAASGQSHDLHASSSAHHYYNQALPEISTTASAYEPFSANASGQPLRGTVLSVLAVILHHTPEGLALYVAAVRHLNIGVAVTVAVVLHSLPDGIALASSIYFACGYRVRGVLWCLLSPVGKLLGASVAWFLIGHSQNDALAHAILTGVACGILLGIGVKEVMPTTHNYAVGKTHGSVIGIVVGMIVIAASKLIT